MNYLTPELKEYYMEDHDLFWALVEKYLPNL